eukprot:Hpha_TRINITY_DN16518_c3_g1::TRINITY_DN16518_c3_g1_i4::g.134214::m.134214
MLRKCSESDARELRLDPAVVRPAHDLEKALVAPLRGPGVLQQPVVLSVLGTPPDQDNGVPSEGATRGVLVDTALVGGEVSVNGEGRRDRAGLHQRLLRAGHSTHAERLRRLGLVLREGNLVVGVGARLLALQLVTALVRLAVRRVETLGARGALVRDASVVLTILPTSLHTSVDEPVGRRGRLPAAAPVAEEPGARGGLPGGVFEVLTSRDTTATLKRLGRSEGPARSAPSLVADLSDHRTVRPLRAGVELGGNRLSGEGSVLGEPLVLVEGVSLGVGPQKRLSVGQSREPRLLGVRGPPRLLLVHILGDLLQRHGVVQVVRFTGIPSDGHGLGVLDSRLATAGCAAALDRGEVRGDGLAVDLNGDVPEGAVTPRRVGGTGLRRVLENDVQDRLGAFAGRELVREGGGLLRPLVPYEHRAALSVAGGVRKHLVPPLARDQVGVVHSLGRLRPVEHPAPEDVGAVLAGGALIVAGHDRLHERPVASGGLDPVPPPRSARPVRGRRAGGDVPRHAHVGDD